MIYYILGILAVVIFHLIMYLKIFEKEKKMNSAHITISVLVALYMVVVMINLYDTAIKNGLGLVKLAAMFVPLGIMMPLVYRRFKAFIIDALFALIYMGSIVIIQKIHGENINPINILFAVFGMLVGYIVYLMINKFAPGIRDKSIIRKRKKQSKFFDLEPEMFMLMLIVLFVIIVKIENISGKTFEKSIIGSPVSSTTSDKNDKYSGIYYAEKSKYSRYDSYASLHPEMSLEDVVWRVDANLDQEFYDESYVKYADADSSSPLLINKFNRVSEDFAPKNLVTIEGNYVSTPATAEAYHDMTEEMSGLGLKVYIVSSYRDVKYQNNLYNMYLKSDNQESVDTYSSRPGFSEHHTGRALDISQVYNDLNAFEGSEEAEWIYNNCYKYGFIVRYKAEQIDVTGYIFEPWHIVYVGKEIAQTMQDEGITTLEEYVVKYVDHKKPKK